MSKTVNLWDPKAKAPKAGDAVEVENTPGTWVLVTVVGVLGCGAPPPGENQAERLERLRLSYRDVRTSDGEVLTDAQLLAMDAEAQTRRWVDVEYPPYPDGSTRSGVHSTYRPVKAKRGKP